MTEHPTFFENGTRVTLTRNRARVWLDDTGEIPNLDLGSEGVVTGQKGSLVLVDFDLPDWSGRPVKVRAAELQAF